MKVVCISNFDTIGDKILDITIGKIYPVFNSDPNGYCTEDDTGKIRWFYYNKFILLSEQRESKLNELLND